MTEEFFRIAVVGTGPAGLYAADELVQQDRIPVRVDLIDRLCTPFGLVRYGVAPDHPRIKSVTGALSTILEHPLVRFLGGVELGSDIGRSDLLACYDAVVYATGLAADRPLGVPGEELPGSHSARELVSWYSGHPDAAQPFSLDAERVAVVGAGNVALDVARILTKPAAALSYTDMPEPVLAALRASAVREVTVIARRGPEHTRFTTKELRELDTLDGVSIRVPADETLPASDTVAERSVRANLALFEKWSGVPAGERTITFRFWRRPIEIRGEKAVRELVLEHTALDDTGQLVATGGTETLPVGVVLRSVGYHGMPIAGLPFDRSRGVVRQHAGRIVDEEGRACSGEYVAGWLKRGPSGVIGTNRADSADTIAALLDDLSTSGGPRAVRSLDDLLARNGSRPVPLSGWRAIDSREIALGAEAGRDRIKITDWSVLRTLGAHEAPTPVVSNYGRE
ncbi:FAD-dependent oxidoreductase [Nocardia sp. CA-135398]|uniref:FAD-dependent oxidoreductase n=1 Tax=Nocardia sp. CA-135398 TaxID=3239977 RepID=UPI003D9726AB